MFCSSACRARKVVQSFLFGDAGVGRHLRQGQTVVDLSTIAYAATTEIGRALDEKGVAFLDAPISGMEARAIDGTLTVMCGGAPRGLRSREAVSRSDRQ